MRREVWSATVLTLPDEEAHCAPPVSLALFPTVTPDTEATAAAQVMARERLAGLIVWDTDGRPYAILPGSQLVGSLIWSALRSYATA